MKPSEFNHIILPMRDELLGYARSVTRSEDNAEDLVQEVILRLWDMRERLSSEGRLKSLAMTMVRNMFLDQQRHESHSAAMPDKIDIAVVAQLPPLQQQIFRMKEIEGYTAEEIMQITGCTADNLRRNLSRARTKIRETYIKIMMKGTRK